MVVWLWFGVGIFGRWGSCCLFAFWIPLLGSLVMMVCPSLRQACSTSLGCSPSPVSSCSSPPHTLLPSCSHCHCHAVSPFPMPSLCSWSLSVFLEAKMNPPQWLISFLEEPEVAFSLTLFCPILMSVNVIRFSFDSEWFYW